MKRYIACMINDTVYNLCFPKCQLRLHVKPQNFAMIENADYFVFEHETILLSKRSVATRHSKI